MKPIKTLFVDDDINIHDITKILIDLGKLPFDCRFALSGEEGLKVLRSSTDNFPEVIFVDINMPLMDGFGFLNHYENEFLTGFPNTLLFMLTSSMRSTDKDRIKKYTFVKDFLPKPLEPELWEEIHIKYLY